ncbi:release factor glutamine methyltransferase [Ruminococcus sp. YRD2003]|uniref:peptide chain release factor N(5)-glutamine methyltransferase n=1 Tax=Ruminococcus sp. YRD2003 TaxID=1452313 RepID=UPI0008D6E3B2|nr:release factor glutamine methyltransferase [Ruminococcus flavefaciens]
MVSRSELFRECQAALEAAGNPDARFDMMCIFQDCLGDRNPLFSPLEAVPTDAEALIRAMTERRISGEPLQYILGEWEFYGYPFKVGAGVLIPRPDTETLVDNVIQLCRGNGLTAPKIADLCAGSGCIAVTLKKELPLAEVSAVELSQEALPYLRQNVRLNEADVGIVAGDVLAESTAAALSGLDIVVSNPPYLTAQEMNDLQAEVRREPEMALDGGGDGLGFYRRLTPLWKRSLKSGGFICYEFGMGQHDKVGNILAENGFVNIKFTRDLGGIIRTVTAQKSEENNG